MKITIDLCEDIGGALYADGVSFSAGRVPYKAKWVLIRNGRKQFFRGRACSPIGAIEILFTLPYRFHKMIKNNPEKLYNRLFGMIPPDRIERELAEVKQRLLVIGESL